MKKIILIIALFFTAQVNAQLSIDSGKTAFSVDAGKTATSLVEGPMYYTPTVAFSNHRLPGSDPSIPVMKVRRVTAGDEKDAYDFRGTRVLYANGWIDQAAETLYVVTWYDQSGNGNHATQTTAASQPEVVLNQSNGYPILDFDGTDDYLDMTGFTNANSDYTFAVRAQTDLLIGGGGYLFDSSLGRFIIAFPRSQNTVAWYDGSWHEVAFTDASMVNLTYSLCASACTTIYKNSIAIATDQVYTKTEIGGTTTIGANYLGTTSNFPGQMTSQIIFNYLLNPQEVSQVSNYFDSH